MSSRPQLCSVAALVHSVLDHLDREDGRSGDHQPKDENCRLTRTPAGFAECNASDQGAAQHDGRHRHVCQHEQSEQDGEEAHLTRRLATLLPAASARLGWRAAA
jgi:hypothetical protein